jgi:hypothetical protein
MIADTFSRLYRSVFFMTIRGRSQIDDFHPTGEIPMNNSAPPPIRAGDKVNRDAATEDQGKVRLGDCAPVFLRSIRAGDKVNRDAATEDQGKVRLGDCAPVFVR